jgi:ATP-dependent HslUV protease subunit HslV
MTAIAYRDGVLAADSGVWDGNLLAGTVRKVHRLEDGRLYAASGREVDVQACRNWLNGADPERRPPPVDRETGFSALIVGAEVLAIARDMRIYTPPAARFYALGCHYEFLLGAMAAGASAAEAVNLACRYGDGAREPVQVESV